MNTAFVRGGRWGSATGGILSGPSHASGGILIEAEGDEYITNKKRVSELGKNFFDFINFAPLQQVKNALSNISIPSLHIPTLPKFAYATGGYVGSGTVSFPADSRRGELQSPAQLGHTDLAPLESRIDTLIDKISDGFNKLDKKDYNINIKSHLNSIRYIREHNKALNEYNRKMN